MSLYWVIRTSKCGSKHCLLQDAVSPVDAAYQSNEAGFVEKLSDVIHVDDKTAARIDKRDIGRVMSMDEAQAIIESR